MSKEVLPLMLQRGLNWTPVVTHCFVFASVLAGWRSWWGRIPAFKPPPRAEKRSAARGLLPSALSYPAAQSPPLLQPCLQPLGSEISWCGGLGKREALVPWFTSLLLGESLYIS